MHGIKTFDYCHNVTFQRGQDVASVMCTACKVGFSSCTCSSLVEGMKKRM